MPGCRAEHELRPRQRGDRRLFVIQVALTLPAGIQLDDVIAEGPVARKRATAEPRVPAAETKPSSWLSQLTTQVLSIVRQPRPVTFSSIGVPTGPDVGVSCERLRDVDAVLRDRLAVDERDHFVHTAVVFGNREARVEPAIRVDRKLSERRRRLRGTSCRGNGSSPR